MKRALIIAAMLVASPASASQPGTVVEGRAIAIDGDTIRIGETRVRLNGVAAPELSEDRGHEAKEAMAEILATGPVRCALTGATTYNREVGTCWIGTADVGALIIGRSLARDCPRYSGGRYAAVETEESRRLPLPPYCRTGR